MIRNTNINDINSIIDLHLNSFTSNHFSAVFSEELLYKYFMRLLSFDKYNYVLFDDQSRRLLGYVIAGFNHKAAVNEFIKDNIMQLIWVLINHPKFLAEKLYEIYQRLFGLGYNPDAKCRLYLIAVRDEVKGKGVAKMLIAHLEKELIRDGQKEYGLSVRKDNKEAINFYNKNGYTVEIRKSKSIYYCKKLTDLSHN